MARRPPAVAKVLERVTGTARRHDMLPPGQTVMVSVSGGPDSICLLHALHRLRRLFRIRLIAFHFDHLLHRGSGAHASYVRRAAGRLRVPFVLRRAEDRPARGQSVEAWARLARYGALSQAAVEEGADRIAVAHTRDDQAETVLLGLARGGGLDAVAGMAPVASVPPLGLLAVRPIIDVTREEVEAFCRALGLRPREDPANRDPRFLRNRIRRLLPTLERRLDRRIRGTLARTAEHVRADAAYLEALASEAARQVIDVDETEIRLRASRLAELPEPVGSRVARHALRLGAAMGGEWDADVAAVHVEALLDLARGRPRRRTHLPGALLAVRDREYVRLTHAQRGEGGP